jgi:hypothetical protein
LSTLSPGALPRADLFCPFGTTKPPMSIGVAKIMSVVKIRHSNEPSLLIFAS